MAYHLAIASMLLVLASGFTVSLVTLRLLQLAMLCLTASVIIRVM